MRTIERHPGMILAVEYFGSQQKTVEALGCFSQQTVSRVLNCENKPAPELALAIHKATNGKVPKWVIRPDLFDAPIEEHA